MTLEVHNGSGYTWDSLEPWDPLCLAVKCSLCGSCTPDALSQAIDDGVELQFDAFIDDPQETISLFTDELERELVADNERHKATYYRHARTFHLTHLWALDVEARQALLDKICRAADQEPFQLYEQFGVL